MNLVKETDHREPIDKEKLGPEERQLIDALHGTGEVGKRLKADLEKNKNKAKYKLEVHFGKNRSMKREALNIGAIMIWESGRRFHGGGDEKMYWCGWSKDWKYTDVDKPCGKPILSKNFGINHVVCPNCNKENFLDIIQKKKHILAAQKGGKDTKGLQRIPVVCGERFFRATPMKLSEMLAQYWRELDGNADLYLKYHPSDIRCRDVAEVKKPDLYDAARTKRQDGLLIYPLDRISKDIAAGASLEQRFLACINS